MSLLPLSGHRKTLHVIWKSKSLALASEIENQHNLAGITKTTKAAATTT